MEYTFWYLDHPLLSLKPALPSIINIITPVLSMWTYWYILSWLLGWFLKTPFISNNFIDVYYFLSHRLHYLLLRPLSWSFPSICFFFFKCIHSSNICREPTMCLVMFKGLCWKNNEARSSMLSKASMGQQGQQNTVWGVMYDHRWSHLAQPGMVYGTLVSSTWFLGW